VQQPFVDGLPPILAKLPERVGPLRRDAPSWRSKVEEVALGRLRPPRADESLKGRRGLGPGSEECTGVPRSVTSRRSPDATRRRYFDRFWRSSRTPTWLDPMCTPGVARLP
jgi:hypothetical protein